MAVNEPWRIALEARLSKIPERSKVPEVPKHGMCTVAASEKRCSRIANPDAYVEERTLELAEAIHARFSENKYYTLAVGVAVDKRGCDHKMLATSRKHSPFFSVPPEVITLAPPRFDEIGVRTFGHAEENIVLHAGIHGWKLISIGATRPVCPVCMCLISLFGIRSRTVEKYAELERD